MNTDFKDILAAIDGENSCSVFCDYRDAYDFIVFCSIKLFGIPKDLSEIETSDIDNGNLEKAIQIGNLSGYLILCKQIFNDGWSAYDVCDEISGELEYAMSALQEDGAPLNELSGDEYQDVFYINELIMEEQYKLEELQIPIIDNLPNMIFRLYHICPQVLAYFPAPLPYEENPIKKLKKDMAVIAAGEIISREFDADYENNTEFQLGLDEEQANYILGRRNPGDPYPETAKNIEIWDFYQKAGFSEINNSRLLCKIANNGFCVDGI